MSLTKKDIKNTYPLPIYNYKVDINGETLSFSEVSGLNITYETHTYKESKDGMGVSVMNMPIANWDPLTITLKKGYVKANSINVFYDWINSIQLNQVEKKDITISLCDETGAAVVTWKVMNAFPTKLDVPSFDANSKEVAVESMELSADLVTMSEG